MARVRVRGIHATALTERLRDDHAVVAPSDAIAERFAGEVADDADDGGGVDADGRAAFDEGPPTVALEDAPDRRGVGLVGGRDDVAAVRATLTGVARDAVAWDDPAPRGARFEATVTETLRSGAVVDLGAREAYLPYDDADRRVEDGDVLPVQVRRPAPPWVDRRPEVATGLVARAGAVALVRGGDGPRADVADPERAAELTRSVDLLSTEVPDGWSVRFGRSAADASLAALDDALALAAERAAALLEADATGGDGPPLATAWVWFGREARFALDAARRAVVPTMPGHHRVKAVGDAAGAAVDLVEALCGQRVAAAADGEGAGPDDGGGSTAEEGFPFDAVADAIGPSVGDRLALSHGKPDGRRFSLGTGTVTDRDGDAVALRRELSAGGAYDGLGVAREDGDVAVTRLVEGRWWYPTVYRDAEGTVKGTYVNVCTPVEVFPDAAVYLDLEVDVVRHADGTVERLDDDELDAAVDAGHLSEPLAAKAREVASAVERGLSS